MLIANITKYYFFFSTKVENRNTFEEIDAIEPSRFRFNSSSLYGRKPLIIAVVKSSNLEKEIMQNIIPEKANDLRIKYVSLLFLQKLIITIDKIMFLRSSR